MRDKVRQEIRKHVPKNIKSFHDLTEEQWRLILFKNELLVNCNYLDYVVAEALRLEPTNVLSGKLIVT